MGVDHSIYVRPSKLMLEFKFEYKITKFYLLNNVLSYSIIIAFLEVTNSHV